MPRKEKVELVTIVERRTAFGRELDRRGLGWAEAAIILTEETPHRYSRSYIQMLATGKASPQLARAVYIERWAGFDAARRKRVPCESWVPELPIGRA